MAISGDAKWTSASGNLTSAGVPIEEGFAAEIHGHDVSKAEDYNFVAATTAFLTLDQIYYLTD